MTLAARATLVASLSLAACGGEQSAASSPPPALDTAASAATLRAESTAAALDQWNKAEVVKRLEEAGLVVADSGTAPPVPPLAESGDRLHVSGSELRVYVFSSAAAREQGSAGLDTTVPALGYATDWRTRPRVFVVNNLVALLYTPNDRLAERVENVLRARHLRRE